MYLYVLWDKVIIAKGIGFSGLIAEIATLQMLMLGILVYEVGYYTLQCSLDL